MSNKQEKREKRKENQCHSINSPVPGGPYNSTPLGAVIPMLLNNSDLVMGKTTNMRKKNK